MMLLSTVITNKTTKLTTELKKNKNREDTFMKSITKTKYMRPLFPNDEGVDQTTNPSLKNTRDLYVGEKLCKVCSGQT